MISYVYHLRLLEEDKNRDRVKVRYVGYGSECDEWRAREDIVILDEAVVKNLMITYQWSSAASNSFACMMSLDIESNVA